ncbi:aminoglycoside phosphotransferase family protein [Leisingera caerulea]|uniref:aminoglycoside phosphotransferase family protein n=1 Tax=Leisingera caerulea TaxID=506591 RepID=UPI0009FC7105|nr:aminoglycoside phosphotransferase family protein [Leisingera caerulea]
MTGGRSNHVWRAGGLVIKLYAADGNNPLFANDPAREIAVLTVLSGTGMVPSLVQTGVFEGRRWLAYAHVNGSPWQQDTGHVAQLLGRLHDLAPPPGLPEGVNGSAALEVQTFEILKSCHDRDQLAALRPLGQVPPLPQPVLIHGDPVPGNLLAHDGTLTLIDWQCPQIGDPAEDLALFLSPAMQLMYRGAPLSKPEEDAFLAAYPDPRIAGRVLALKPWFHWRMAAYCLWRAERGSARDREAFELERAALQSIRPSSA